MVRVPPAAGDVFERLDPLSQVMAPLELLRRNLYWNAVLAGTVTVTNQTGYVLVLDKGPTGLDVDQLVRASMLPVR